MKAKTSATSDILLPRTMRSDSIFSSVKGSSPGSTAFSWWDVLDIAYRVFIFDYNITWKMTFHQLKLTQIHNPQTLVLKLFKQLHLKLKIGIFWMVYEHLHLTGHNCDYCITKFDLQKQMATGCYLLFCCLFYVVKWMFFPVVFAAVRWMGEIVLIELFSKINNFYSWVARVFTFFCVNIRTDTHSFFVCLF